MELVTCGCYGSTESVLENFQLLSGVHLPATNYRSLGGEEEEEEEGGGDKKKLIIPYLTPTFLANTHHLIGALLGGLLQLLECRNPAILLGLILSQNQHLALEPNASLLVTRHLEDGRNQLGASVNHIMRRHFRHLEVLVPDVEDVR